MDIGNLSGDYISEISPYELSHLTEHLYHTDNTNLLYQLVTSDVWLSLSTKFDRSRQQYNSDIELSYRDIVTKTTSRVGQEEGGGLEMLLAQITALSWLSAYLKQSAGLMNINTLEAMTRLGNGEQALRRASLIPDPIRKATALIWIGFGAYEIKFHQIANEAWKRAYQLINQTPLDFDNELFNAKALLASILARIGDTERAISLVYEVNSDVNSEIEHAGGVMSTNQYALTRAWASVGEVDHVFHVASELTDIENRLFAICEAAEVQFINSMEVSPGICNEALSLQPQVTEERSLKRLAEVLPYCGYMDQAVQIIEKGNFDNLVWVLRSRLGFVLIQEDNDEIEAVKTRIIENVKGITDHQNRLRTCASLILGNHKDFIGRNLSNLLPLLQDDFDHFSREIDTDTLGRCALALIFLGDNGRGHQALEMALQVELYPDDWDETYALIDFARLFGSTGDATKLREVLASAEKRKDLWQLGEIIVAVSEAATGFGDLEISNNAKEALFKITSSAQDVAKRPNVLSALAIWHRNQTNDPQHPKVRETIQQALDLLVKDEDDADAIAYFGLTMAQNGMPFWAKHVLNYTIRSLRQEDDPNTIARVVGTAAHVAALLSDKDVLLDLQEIARSINDEWLQAEALFWLAGWWAYLGEVELAGRIFLQAIEYGAWNDINPGVIQQAWTDRDRAKALLVTADYIGWPSTKVAVIFSELAILLCTPKPWHIDFGLDAIELIPEEYSEKRALYLSMLITAFGNAEDSHKEIIRIYLGALRQAKNRHTGEFWASLRSCLPFLVGMFGKSIGVAIWEELMRMNTIQI